MKKRGKEVLVLGVIVSALLIALILRSGGGYEKVSSLPVFKTYMGPGSLADENQVAPGGVSFVLSEQVVSPESEAVLWELYYEHDQRELGSIREVLEAENMTLDDGAVEGNGSVFHVEKNGEWWFSNPKADVLCEKRGPGTTIKDSSGASIKVPGKCEKTATLGDKTAVLKRANEIIEAVGGSVELSSYYADTESQSVTNETNNVTTYVSFGANGDVQYASGRLGVLREHGKWPLASVKSVVKDLGVKADPLATIPGCSKSCGTIPETKVEVVRVEIEHTTRQDIQGRVWVVPMYALYDAANVVWYAEALSGLRTKN
jgi:hypothetical protein